MNIEDRRQTPVIRIQGFEIPDGFFLARDGSFWFKDSEGIVLIDARGNCGKSKRVPLRGVGSIREWSGYWRDPQPVHGVIRIERNA